MAVPSAKARRAHTPLSSPAASPSLPVRSYAFREGSYYTDDQSDGCYGGDRGATSASTCNNQPESDSNHDEHCTHHGDASATHCNALTQARKKCSRKAKVFAVGFLPVCGTHHRYWAMRESGRCQAIEECGHVCNRFAPHAPPYHLCTKHEKGTGTLPCGIMNLPAELHLMIFRYLFPRVVSSLGLLDRSGAVLRVNQAFYVAASSVLYGEREFEASVNANCIYLFGRHWDRDSFDEKDCDINKILCQAGAQRIRNLHVTVRFGVASGKIKGIGTHDISHEDYTLYQVRDAVRKFVDMLRPPLGPTFVSDNPTLKQVRVQPIPQTAYAWKTDEAVAAVFFVLEPFVALGPIENPVLLPCPLPSVWHNRFQGLANVISNLHKDKKYCRLRDSWRQSMEKRPCKPNRVRREGKSELLVTVEHYKIEELLKLIQKHESVTATKHGWTSGAFQGIERVLHIVRMVDLNINSHSNDDVDRMLQIRDAILKRWVNAHRQQQRSLSAIATCINDMFHSESPIVPNEAYPDAFEFELLDPIDQNATISYTWPELGKADPAPRLGDPDVTYTEEDLRIFIHKKKKMYVRLKTPAVVRQLRALKRA